MPLLQTDYRRLCSPSLTNHDEADGPMAMQPPRICHDTLPWLMSYSLDLNATRYGLPERTQQVSLRLLRQERATCRLCCNRLRSHQPIHWAPRLDSVFPLPQTRHRRFPGPRFPVAAVPSTYTVDYCSCRCVQRYYRGRFGFSCFRHFPPQPVRDHCHACVRHHTPALHLVRRLFCRLNAGQHHSCRLSATRCQTDVPRLCRAEDGSGKGLTNL